MFERYQRVVKKRCERGYNYFDLSDIVSNLMHRLERSEPDFVIHRIYVDEVQDFLQAELALLIKTASDPNSLFLTGDTAQGITRGVGFRFEDLKSLFYYAQQEAQATQAVIQRPKVEVPKTVLHLKYNYRSHGGILSMASSVIELLTEFFPETFGKFVLRATAYLTSIQIAYLPIVDSCRDPSQC